MKEPSTQRERSHAREDFRVGSDGYLVPGAVDFVLVALDVNKGERLPAHAMSAPTIAQHETLTNVGAQPRQQILAQSSPIAQHEVGELTEMQLMKTTLDPRTNAST